MNFRDLEAAITRESLYQLSIMLLIVAGFFWVLYAVTKAAIRDGIKEGLHQSGLMRAIVRSNIATAPAGFPA
jgi:hypothetical protein